MYNQYQIIIEAFKLLSRIKYVTARN